MSGGGDNRASLGTKGFSKADVGHNALVKEGVGALAGTVNKLVGNNQIQGGIFLLQAAHGAD